MVEFGHWTGDGVRNVMGEVKVRPSRYAKLQEYANRTRTPMEEIVDRALETFLRAEEWRTKLEQESLGKNV